MTKSYNWHKIVSTLIVSNWQVVETQKESKSGAPKTITEIKLRYRSHTLSFKINHNTNFEEVENWFMSKLFNMIDFEEGQKENPEIKGLQHPVTD